MTITHALLWVFGLALTIGGLGIGLAWVIVRAVFAREDRRRAEVKARARQVRDQQRVNEQFAQIIANLDGE